MKVQAGTEAWLGLLVLALAVGLWLNFPGWLTNLFGFLFSASLIILVAGFVWGSVLSRLPLLRRVRFGRASLQSLVPWRVRWFGAGRQLGWRHYRTSQRRRGWARAFIRQRGCELLTISLVPLTVGAAVYGLYVENPWLSVGLTIGAPGLGLGAILQLQKLSEKLKRERRRHSAPRAHEALAQDSRPPVVLLRSFRDDGREAGFIIDREVSMSFEEVVTEPLYGYGPVVAIGRPGEPLPPLGALREYVQADWQSHVRAWLDAAAVIVAILDDTQGLVWELTQIFELKFHPRLILVVPQGSVGELEQKWQAVCACIERIDPSRGQNARSLPMRQVLAIVFNHDLSAERILGSERLAEYYRDAVALAAWFLQSRAGKSRKASRLADA